VGHGDGTVVDGRYRLLRRVARGPMSTVWLADDLELERRVALKFLAPGAAADRFRREARAGAALVHPNVCRVFDVGETADGPYLVTEFLGGGTLEDRLREGERLADDDARSLARQLAAALAHAHGHGIVHRDLKPSNVLFDDERTAKVADFGIAAVAGAEPLTEDGTVLGTAAYMSPEQAAGEPATAASDVYAYGVLLFRVLTGRLPFVQTDDPLAVARAHVTEPPPAVLDLRPDAPTDLAALAAAALAKDPRDRPADGAALAAELAGPIPTTDATAMTAVIAPPPARRRSPVWRGAAVVAVVAALALAGFGLARLSDRGSAGDEPGPTGAATTGAATSEPDTSNATEPAAGDTRATEPATTATPTTEPATTEAPPTEPPPPTPTQPAPPPPPPPPAETQPATGTTPTTTEPGTTEAPPPPEPPPETPTTTPG
jgi:serine/threonine protein kinase